MWLALLFASPICYPWLHPHLSPSLLPCSQVIRIQDRIHRLLAIPKEFGEGMYVLRYQHMQQYRRCVRWVELGGGGLHCPLDTWVDA